MRWQLDVMLLGREVGKFSGATYQYNTGANRAQRISETKHCPRLETNDASAAAVPASDRSTTHGAARDASVLLAGGHDGACHGCFYGGEETGTAADVAAGGECCVGRGEETDGTCV